MKLCIALALLAGYFAVAVGCNGLDSKSGAAFVAFDGRTPAREYVLSQNARKKDGAPVPFNHENHSTKNYSADGTRPLACVECHHTDQPAADAAKTPPLKTAHPADRKTTLTADLLAKDATAPDVVSCRACHAQEGEKPRIGSGIPSITYEGDTDPTVLNNEEAYHRNCNVCHDLAVERRKDLKIPTSQSCKECHTGKK